MSEKKVNYYERDGVLFRDMPGKPLEIFQNGWTEYDGDVHRVYRESDVVTEEAAWGMIKDNIARWSEIYKQKKAA